MAEDAAIQVLKKALLLERQGKLFYEQVAAQTSSQAVKNLFGILAMEEGKHIDFLSQEFGQHALYGRFADLDLKGDMDTLARTILSEEVRRQITAASYEAAAISAAIELENRSVAVYSERASITSDPEEKALYQRLAQWEMAHQQFLAQINQDLIEEIWYESKFWPF